MPAFTLVKEQLTGCGNTRITLKCSAEHFGELPIIVMMEELQDLLTDRNVSPDCIDCCDVEVSVARSMGVDCIQVVTSTNQPPDYALNALNDRFGSPQRLLTD